MTDRTYFIDIKAEQHSIKSKFREIRWSHDRRVYGQIVFVVLSEEERDIGEVLFVSLNQEKIGRVVVVEVRTGQFFNRGLKCCFETGVDVRKGERFQVVEVRETRS